MSIADDIATINALRSTLATLALTPAEMVQLIDAAIATALSKGGMPVVGHSAAGKSVSISFDQARNLRTYYKTLADQEDSNELVVGQAEFAGDW